LVHSVPYDMRKHMDAIDIPDKPIAIEEIEE
jgi:hypothetical protein